MIDPNDTRTLPLGGVPPAGVPIERVTTEWQCACRFSRAWQCAEARRSPSIACSCPCHATRAAGLPRLIAGEQLWLHNGASGTESDPSRADLQPGR